MQSGTSWSSIFSLAFGKHLCGAPDVQSHRHAADVNKDFSSDDGDCQAIDSNCLELIPIRYYQLLFFLSKIDEYMLYLSI